MLASTKDKTRQDLKFPMVLEEKNSCDKMLTIVSVGPTFVCVNNCDDIEFSIDYFITPVLDNGFFDYL